jgi:hypothetical protein
MKRSSGSWHQDPHRSGVPPSHLGAPVVRARVEGRDTVSLNEDVFVGDLVSHVVKSLLAGHGGEGVRLCDRKCCAVKH